MEVLWVPFPVTFRPPSPTALEADSHSKTGIKQEAAPTEPDCKIPKYGYDKPCNGSRTTNNNNNGTQMDLVEGREGRVA